jgi:hypothetical protein
MTQPKPNASYAGQLANMMTKIMIINTNPFMKKSSKTEKILSALCKLSDEPFEYIVVNVIKELNIGGDKKYDSVESETKALLTKYPRLTKYKDLITSRVRKGREKLL